MRFRLIHPIAAAIMMAAVRVNSAGAQAERSENIVDSTVTGRDSIKIRFTIVYSVGSAERRWVGSLEEVRRDSIVLRVADADTLASFARRDLLFLQRWHPSRRPAKAARVGCFALGAAMGAVSLAVPEATGAQRVFGLVVGCGIGTLVGAAAGALSHQWWKPFDLPPG